MDKRLCSLNGVFAVLKPAGESSAKTVDRVKKSLIRAALGEKVNPEQQHYKRFSRQIKVGHGGTLDPMATGVLVIGLNGGCKILAKYLSGPKSYCAQARFGEHYDTLDCTGKLLQRDEKWKEALEKKTCDDLQKLCDEKFVGEAIMQVPPAFSAIHVDGKRAYELARSEQTTSNVENSNLESSCDQKEQSSNVETPKEQVDSLETPCDSESIKYSVITPQREAASFQLAARPVAIYSLSVQCEPEGLPDFSLQVSCGGGCYIRSLIRDFSAELGTLAHMTALERTKQGIFTPEMCLKSDSEWSNLDSVEEAINRANSLL